MKFLFIMVGNLLFLTQLLVAQNADTIKVTLPEAEQQFAQKNFLLLAQKYNVEGAKAAIIQANLLPNPTLTIQQGLVPYNSVSNGENVVPFEERVFQIEQVIQLAGKRNKQVALAKIGLEISEYQFAEIIRELLFQLRSSFYQIHFLEKTLLMYDQEIQNISRLVSAYQEQVQKGNLPQKELIRLQSFLITLQTEESDIKNQITDNETTLRILLAENSTQFIEPKLNESQIIKLNLSGLNLENLLSSATENRPDLKTQEASTRLATANLKLQKALAKPDVTIGYSYDRAGSYVNNYHALTVSVSLPFFNKNQGNIKAAENQIEANKQYLAQTSNQLENEVLQAYTKAKESENLFRKIDPNYQASFEKLVSGVLENYQKRNLTLIEFTDFLESYKNTVSQLNTLQSNRMQAFENLNFVVGKKVL
jgi:outer membrane protein, heavy metal efflux system